MPGSYPSSRSGQARYLRRRRGDRPSGPRRVHRDRWQALRHRAHRGRAVRHPLPERESSFEAARAFRSATGTGPKRSDEVGDRGPPPYAVSATMFAMKSAEILARWDALHEKGAFPYSAFGYSEKFHLFDIVLSVYRSPESW